MTLVLPPGALNQTGSDAGAQRSTGGERDTERGRERGERRRAREMEGGRVSASVRGKHR